MDSTLTCCLCNFEASSDSEIETHIDVSHADIFCLGNNDINQANGIKDNNTEVNFDQVKIVTISFFKNVM